ncbi:hypothetical protein LCGC14_2690680, partial [marine sediment metagenome]
MKLTDKPKTLKPFEFRGNFETYTVVAVPGQVQAAANHLTTDLLGPYQVQREIVVPDFKQTDALFG